MTYTVEVLVGMQKNHFLFSLVETCLHVIILILPHESKLSLVIQEISFWNVLQRKMMHCNKHEYL